MPGYSEQQPKRRPAKEVMIKDLQKENGRVAVLGEISKINKKDLECTISDGEEEAKLLFNDAKQLNSLRENELCRAIGKTVFNSNPPEINVETIHNMKGFDLGLWRKVREIEAGTND